ncbi:MFS general substrate transporter [Ceratobasidium sp. AG-I]|nr:MFS general substrate transporter [Ceratobasidium sp. AG-I]
MVADMHDGMRVGKWRRWGCWAFSQACVACNTLSSGGVFLFPLFVPSLKEHLKLTQSELSTIVLAGMMGQYTFAAGWGVVVDRIGPWACSLSASVLFLFSYGAFAYLLSHGLGNYRALAALFFVAGCGRVASYFSAIFSVRGRGSSGLATSVPMALSGLSPLFLSYVTSMDVFQTESGGLNTPKFVGWMAVGCGILHALGAVGLRHSNDAYEKEEGVGERRALLSSVGDEERVEEEDGDKVIRTQCEAIKAGCIVVHGVEPDGSVFGLLKDVSFWVFVAVGIVITGTAEMVISNMGSIVMEFPGEQSAATQVRLISIAGTIARLCTGPLADYVSPPVDAENCNCQPVQEGRRISRLVFPTTFLATLGVGYLWTAAYVVDADGLWLLSLGTGLAYGGSWAVLPSITSAIWGERNLGRNFGILSYAPLVGTPIFTYLYAWSSEGERPEGVNWRTTFTICGAVVGVALMGCGVLWRRWSGRL